MVVINLECKKIIKRETMDKVKQKINMMLSEVAGCNLIYENINGNPIDFFHHSTSFIYIINI